MARKLKNKVWITIHAPEVFNNVVVGETVTRELNNVIGRTVWVNLGNLLGDVSKGKIKLLFKITDAKGNEAYTQIYKYELLAPFLARIIRRKTTKIDVIDDYVTKDNKKVRVKMVIVTDGRAKGDRPKQIRAIAKEKIKEFTLATSLDNLFLSAISGELQKIVNKEVKKVMPISAVEVWKIERKD